MIPLEVQLLIAILLDTLIGDPQWWPHPVRLIGALAVFLENHARKSIDDEKIAGLLTVCLVVAITGAVTISVVSLGYLLNPMLGDAVSIFIIYTGIATRDLAKHAELVRDALGSGDLSLARERVAMICGRDTNTLDTQGVVRATVESVAENTVDGVTAPLFYGVIGGPVGVMVYKAVSTLDSTFGYRNERYELFGWASAKLDDIAAFLPSRITSLLVPCAAWILGMNSRDSLRILKRDRLKHASPNSAHSEAAFSGALGVRLGGPNYYSGVLHDKPFLGDPIVEPDPGKIAESVKLMILTTLLSFLTFVALWPLFKLFLKCF